MARGLHRGMLLEDWNALIQLAFRLSSFSRPIPKHCVCCQSGATPKSFDVRIVLQISFFLLFLRCLIVFSIIKLVFPYIQHHHIDFSFKEAFLSIRTFQR